MNGAANMTIALWCVLIAGLLPYAGTLAAKWGFKRYDNHDPRAWLASQTGFRARGNAAQANSFETFPLFAAAVIVATVLKAPHTLLDGLAVAFILSRAGYLACYLADQANLRSLCWLGGQICSVTIFMVAAVKA